MTNMIVSCYSCAAQGAKASTATVVALALVPWAIQQQIMDSLHLRILRMISH